MTKNGQKCLKNMGFGLFILLKSPKTMFFMSLVLSGNCVKWKFLWFINILQKLHTQTGSQVIAKKGFCDFSIL